MHKIAFPLLISLLTISTSFAQAPPPPGGDPGDSTITIMAMGDSNTRGFHGAPEEKGAYRHTFTQYMDIYGHEYNMVGEFEFSRNGLVDDEHQGVGGYQIEDMVSNYGAAVAQYQPDLVLLMAGTNNHIDALDYDQFYNRYDHLFSMIFDNAPNTQVIVSTVPKFGCCLYDDLHEHWTEAFVERRNTQTFPFINGVMQDVASTYSNVSVIDFFSEMNPRRDLTTDQVHLNHKGHEILGQMFFSEFSGISVPEPGSAIVLMGGMILALRRRRS